MEIFPRVLPGVTPEVHSEIFPGEFEGISYKSYFLVFLGVPSKVSVGLLSGISPYFLIVFIREVLQDFFQVSLQVFLLKTLRGFCVFIPTKIKTGIHPRISLGIPPGIPSSTPGISSMIPPGISLAIPPGDTGSRHRSFLCIHSEKNGD